MLSYCLNCAAQNRTCCQHVNIFITQGDVERIVSWGETEPFYTYLPITPEYNDPDDPGWNGLILDETGRRRVIRPTENDQCHFLTPTGCRLPADVRPLLCRIYPWDYRAGKVHGICKSCPVADSADWTQILQQSGMPYEKAVNWVETLYREIYLEKQNAPQVAVIFPTATGGIPPLSSHRVL